MQKAIFLAIFLSLTFLSFTFGYTLFSQITKNTFLPLVIFLSTLFAILLLLKNQNLLKKTFLTLLLIFLLLSLESFHHLFYTEIANLFLSTLHSLYLTILLNLFYSIYIWIVRQEKNLA